MEIREDDFRDSGFEGRAWVGGKGDVEDGPGAGVLDQMGAEGGDVGGEVTGKEESKGLKISFVWGYTFL